MELRREGRAVVVGHRGAAALAPENSLEAIEAAAAAGADAVELDVLGVDGTLVLGHGPELSTGAATLDDALALVSRLGLAVQVDVKLAGFEAAIAASLRSRGLLEHSFVSSASPPILLAFAAAEPSLPRA